MKSPLELAHAYMEAFYTRFDPAALQLILHPELRFEGPLFEFHSRAAYLDSLVAAPPLEFSFTLIQTFESEDAACLLYRFQKPGVETVMAQTFRVEEGRIREIQLLFDTKPFSEEEELKKS